MVASKSATLPEMLKPRELGSLSPGVLPTCPDPPECLHHDMALQIGHQMS